MNLLHLFSLEYSISSNGKYQGLTLVFAIESAVIIPLFLLQNQEEVIADGVQNVFTEARFLSFHSHLYKYSNIE
jgi:hypothetical protein